MYKVDYLKIKKLILKTFPEIEVDWDSKIGPQKDSYVS